MITNVEIIFIEKKSLCSNFCFFTLYNLGSTSPRIKITLSHKEGKKNLPASVTLHGQ